MPPGRKGNPMKRRLAAALLALAGVLVTVAPSGWAAPAVTAHRAAVADPAAPLVVLAGDSIIAGSLVAPWDRLDVRMGYRLCGPSCGKPGWPTLVNKGVAGQKLVGGTTIPDLASTWGGIINASPRPDIILVGIGMNDLSAYPGDAVWTNAYISLVVRAQALGIRVLIGQITPVTSAHANIEPLRRSLNGWLAGYFGSSFVVPYQGDIGMSNGYLDPAYATPDGIHPNGWGTGRMADDAGQRLIDLGWATPH